MTTHKVTAKRNRTTTSTTTAKNAGVKSRKATSKTLAQAVARANAENAKRRVRQFATDDGLVAYLDSLPAKRMPADLVNDKTARGAVARREWCEAHGIAPVAVYDDGMGERRNGSKPVNDKGLPDTDLWRPDNAVRERLRALAKVGAQFGYTRYETAPVQTAKVCGLDWRKGLPEHVQGSDLVLIYRV